jgi:ATP-dependent RNA helicase RhlE
MKFSKYNFIPVLSENLERLGFKRPTDIQYKSLPPIMRGEDVLAIAQTGTGKTAAFAIPVVQHIATDHRPVEAGGMRCLVMVPTHELAIQVASVFKEISAGTGLKVIGLYGGVEQDPQIAHLKNGCDVLVATPGRMFDLASQGHLSFRSVQILILDEADHMLERGFYSDMQELVKRIPKRRQTLFFSATIDERIKDLAYGLVKHAVRIQISPKDPVSKNIDHSVMFVEMDDKRFFLERIVREHADSKILVFVRTKVRAGRVVAAMERVGLSAEAIHGDLPQKERSQVMERFYSGQNKVLVATDVSARGIDIPDVEYVINYDLPDLSENYVHRVGRTGRGVKRGIAISFCSSDEKIILDEIESYLDKPVKVLELDPNDYESTIDISEAATHDWKSVVNELIDLEEGKKKLRGKGKGKRL